MDWTRVFAYGGIVGLVIFALLMWCCCKAASDADDRFLPSHDTDSPDEPATWG